MCSLVQKRGSFSKFRRLMTNTWCLHKCARKSSFSSILQKSIYNFPGNFSNIVCKDDMEIRMKFIALDLYCRESFRCKFFIRYLTCICYFFNVFFSNKLDISQSERVSSVQKSLTLCTNTCIAQNFLSI